MRFAAAKTIIPSGSALTMSISTCCFVKTVDITIMMQSTVTHAAAAADITPFNPHITADRSMI